jgi:ATP-binding cassette subfamily F protein 3
MLARFGLIGEIVFQKVSSLSGGERNRAALARLSASDANFLVLDEPTNHLDLWACDSLEASLNRFAGTVLFVSHDRYFLNQVADHLLVVEPARFRVIEGNYETFQQLVKSGLATEAATADAQRNALVQKNAATNTSTSASKSSNEGNDQAGSGTKQKRKRKFPYRKANEIENEIHELEQKVEALNAEMVDPAVLRNGEKIRATHVKLEEAKTKLVKLYEHWEEALELNG